MLDFDATLTVNQLLALHGIDTEAPCLECGFEHHSIHDDLACEVIREREALERDEVEFSYE